MDEVVDLQLGLQLGQAAGEYLRLLFGLRVELQQHWYWHDENCQFKERTDTKYSTSSVKLTRA